MEQISGSHIAKGRSYFSTDQAPGRAAGRKPMPGAETALWVFTSSTPSCRKHSKLAQRLLPSNGVTHATSGYTSLPLRSLVKYEAWALSIQSLRMKAVAQADRAVQHHTDMYVDHNSPAPPITVNTMDDTRLSLIAKFDLAPLISPPGNRQV